MAARSVSGKDTIPTGTSGAGTVSTNAVDTTKIDGTGTAFLTSCAEAVKKADFIWIYFVTAHVVARVVAVFDDVHLQVDRAVPGIAGDTYKIVTGDLVAWSAKNTGGANGTVDGGTVIPNATVNAKPVVDPERRRNYKDVVTCNGTSTTIEIFETK